MLWIQPKSRRQLGVMAGAWIAAACLMADDGAKNPLPPTGDAPPAGAQPCPPVIEIPCDQLSAPGGGALLPNCVCGPGNWMRMEPETHPSADPVAPQHGEDTSFLNYSFTWSRAATAQQDLASASVEASGRSWFGNTGSLAKQAHASFRTLEREVWQGAAPACARDVALVATGGASLSISVTCSANSGCSSSASSAASGACSSLGNASADLDQKTISASAQYNSATGTVKLEGNIGATISVVTPSIQGSYSSQTSWEVHGSGSATGTASFTVKPDRSYCAFTNRPITRRCNGDAIATGAGTVSSNGSCGFAASAFVTMHVD